MTQPRFQEIVSHIGMHNKTGSTAIQSVMAGYDCDGVRYANLGRANHSVCVLLGLKPVTIYRYVGHNGELRENGRRVLTA